jgi:hypothetical protein
MVSSSSFPSIYLCRDRFCFLAHVLTGSRSASARARSRCTVAHAPVLDFTVARIRSSFASVRWQPGLLGLVISPVPTEFLVARSGAQSLFPAWSFGLDSCAAPGLSSFSFSLISRWLVSACNFLYRSWYSFPFGFSHWRQISPSVPRPHIRVLFSLAVCQFVIRARHRCSALQLCDCVRFLVGGFLVLFLSRWIKRLSFYSVHCIYLVISQRCSQVVRWNVCYPLNCFVGPILFTVVLFVSCLHLGVLPLWFLFPNPVPMDNNVSIALCSWPS